MFKFNKIKKDNKDNKPKKNKTSIIELDMNYEYRNSPYNKILFIKKGDSKTLNVSLPNGKMICSIDNGNELKVLLECLIKGEF